MSVRPSWTRWIPRSAISIRRTTEQFCRASVDLLFPPRCVHCESDMRASELGLLCETCQNAMVPERWNPCLRCGADIGDGVPAPETCIHCRKDRLRFDTVVALGPYREELRSALILMKRLVGEPLCHPIGRLIALHRGDWIGSLDPDLIVPVPMYWMRRIARGTNSADLLARSLGESMGISVEPEVLIRCRNTLPQKDLARIHRFANVLGAFRIRTGYSLQGANVLLVDDVLTTGATCSEAAGVLRQAGVAQVAVAVVARAQGIGR